MLQQSFLIELRYSLAFFAKSIKFDVVTQHLEVKFFGQMLFGFAHQFQLFVEKIVIVDDVSAFGTDDMVMMPFFFS